MYKIHVFIILFNWRWSVSLRRGCHGQHNRGDEGVDEAEAMHGMAQREQLALKQLPLHIRKHRRANAEEPKLYERCVRLPEHTLERRARGPAFRLCTWQPNVERGDE